jgi:hypothetical protein
MRDKWAYLIRHVRSKKEVRIIRGNLKLAQERHDHSLQHSALEDAATEKDSLVRDYRVLDKKFQQELHRSSAVEASARQFAKDVREQEEAISQLKARIDNDRRLNRLLTVFLDKTSNEMKQMDEISTKLRDLNSNIFRLEHRERMFADNESMETAAQVRCSNFYLLIYILFITLNQVRDLS